MAGGLKAIIGTFFLRVVLSTFLSEIVTVLGEEIWICHFPMKVPGHDKETRKYYLLFPVIKIDLKQNAVIFHSSF